MGAIMRQVKLSNFIFFHDQVLDELNVEKIGNKHSFPVFDNATIELFNYCLELQAKVKQLEDYPLLYDVQELE